MLRDLENVEIVLSDIPNPHKLLLGNSGYGKTYAVYRLIEKELIEDKSCLIIDYSGSYTQCERKKADFLQTIRELNPYKDGVVIQFKQTSERVSDILCHALLMALGIMSYYQKRILKDVIRISFKKYDKFSMKLLEEILCSIECDSKEMQKNVGHLLTRFGPYFEIDKLIFKCGTIGSIQEKATIMQISDFPNLEREFLSKFLVELAWSMIRNEVKSNISFQTFCLDEIQNIPLQKGCALYALLRESRKFGITLIVATQLISGFDHDSVNTLFQVGNVMLFHPASSDLYMISKLISTEKSKIYEKLLRNLGIGECLLLGNYYRNKNTYLCKTPLLCSVEKRAFEKGD